MKKDSSVFYPSINLLKDSLIKSLGTLMNRGLFQFPLLKASRCDFNGPSANKPDHSKLSHSVSKANDPNVGNLVGATRRKESRVLTLDQPNQLPSHDPRPNQCFWQEAARLTNGFIQRPFTLWQAQHGLLLSLRFCFWHHIRKKIWTLNYFQSHRYGMCKQLLKLLFFGLWAQMMALLFFIYLFLFL